MWTPGRSDAVTLQMPHRAHDSKALSGFAPEARTPGLALSSVGALVLLSARCKSWSRGVGAVGPGEMRARGARQHAEFLSMAGTTIMAASGCFVAHGRQIDIAEPQEPGREAHGVLGAEMHIDVAARDPNRRHHVARLAR